MTFVDSEPEPDISITLGREDDYARAHPSSAELVVEVAVSSPDLDRANALLYAESAIKEHWIVLALQKQVEVYRQPLQGRYQQTSTYGAKDIIECSALPGVRIRVSELFV